jgi:hypothetical protein
MAYPRVKSGMKSGNYVRAPEQQSTDQKHNGQHTTYVHTESKFNEMQKQQLSFHEISSSEIRKHVPLTILYI